MGPRAEPAVVDCCDAERVGDSPGESVVYGFVGVVGVVVYQRPVEAVGGLFDPVLRTVSFSAAVASGCRGVPVQRDCGVGGTATADLGGEVAWCARR